jgi:hypothetical protein
MTLDVLGQLIDVGEMVPSSRLGMQEFIQFSLDGLGVPMLGSLDEQGHEPDGHGRNGVPVERISFE